jgi:hypothetical protein
MQKYTEIVPEFVARRLFFQLGETTPGVFASPFQTESEFRRAYLAASTSFDMQPEVGVNERLARAALVCLRTMSETGPLASLLAQFWFACAGVGAAVAGQPA